MRYLFYRFAHNNTKLMNTQVTRGSWEEEAAILQLNADKLNDTVILVIKQYCDLRIIIMSR